MSKSLSVSNSWQAPFFGKSSAYVSGRDPLGLQTTSVATYSRLIPGITNVTNRVRYWSFYCWLVHLYSQKISQTNYKRFVQFIRRGEFTLAVAIEVAGQNENAVSGKLQAAKAAQDLPLDLKKYADNDVRSSSRYWKYESGAFGQYFAGVLEELGLLVKNEFRIPVCTDKEQHEHFKSNLEVSGVELAIAFREAISLDIENRFFQTIENGKAGYEDLLAFGNSLTLSAIQTESSEWDLIRKILTGRDSPGRFTKESDSFFRLNTIRLFLDFRQLKAERKILDFPFWFEERNGVGTSGTEEDVPFGWFYYAVNERWHYANELIFSAFLKKLRNHDFSLMKEFIEEFVSKIVQAAVPKASSFSTEQWFEFWNNQASYSENDLQEVVQDALDGFIQILDLYKTYKNQLDTFIRFGQRLGIERRGDFAHGLRNVAEHIHRPPGDFFEWYLMRNIINRHLFVAMDKLASTGVNTQKFKHEEQVLYFINNIGVGYTNPRLNQLALYLQDLQVLDMDFNPTALASSFFKTENNPST
ncbi:MAG: hypothetical protein R2788_15185 [Saprospiraceae bacterium]